MGVLPPPTGRFAGFFPYKLPSPEFPELAVELAPVAFTLGVETPTTYFKLLVLLAVVVDPSPSLNLALFDNYYFSNAKLGLLIPAVLVGFSSSYRGTSGLKRIT